MADKELKKTFQEMAKLAAEMKLLCARTAQTKRSNLPSPTFDGSGDVETFLTRFHETASVNDWDDGEKHLRLKIAITGSAANGTEGKDFDGICEQLRQRYILSETGAMQLLRSLKWRAGDNIYDFVSYLEKIVKSAFPELDTTQRSRRCVKELVNALPSAYHTLQWQLTHQPPASLPDAVKLIHEFGTLQQDRAPKINKVETEEMTEMRKALEGVTKTQQEMSLALASITSSLADLTKQRSSKRDKSQIKCYACGELGHYKRECTNNQGNGKTQ